MPPKILILSSSPKKDGNTATLVDWFCQGARAQGAQCEVVETAFLKYKSLGCTSCRACQKLEQYGCVVPDDGQVVLRKMIDADALVMATPLYFFGPSAQLKIIFDRMFSLYKWDNDAGTMKTPLKGKTCVVLASAFEDIGLEALTKPFELTAEYTGMHFASLLIANAGTSGHIKDLADARQKAIDLGARVARGRA